MVMNSISHHINKAVRYLGFSKITGKYNYIQNIDSRSELVPTLRLTAPEQWSQGCKYLNNVNNHSIITAVNILFTSGGVCKHLAILTFTVWWGSLIVLCNICKVHTYVLCSVICFLYVFQYTYVRYTVCAASDVYR